MAYPREKDIITIIIKVNFIFSFKSGGFAELKKTGIVFLLEPQIHVFTGYQIP